MFSTLLSLLILSLPDSLESNCAEHCICSRSKVTCEYATPTDFYPTVMFIDELTFVKSVVDITKILKAFPKVTSIVGIETVMVNCIHRTGLTIKGGCQETFQELNEDVMHDVSAETKESLKTEKSPEDHYESESLQTEIVSLASVLSITLVILFVVVIKKLIIHVRKKLTEACLKQNENPEAKDNGKNTNNVTLMKQDISGISIGVNTEELLESIELAKAEYDVVTVGVNTDNIQVQTREIGIEAALEANLSTVSRVMRNSPQTTATSVHVKPKTGVKFQDVIILSTSQESSGDDRTVSEVKAPKRKRLRGKRSLTSQPPNRGSFFNSILVGRSQSPSLTDFTQSEANSARDSQHPHTSSTCRDLSSACLTETCESGVENTQPKVPVCNLLDSLEDSVSRSQTTVLRPATPPAISNFLNEATEDLMESLQINPFGRGRISPSHSTPYFQNLPSQIDFLQQQHEPAQLPSYVQNFESQYTLTPSEGLMLQPLSNNIISTSTTSTVTQASEPRCSTIPPKTGKYFLRKNALGMTEEDKNLLLIKLD